MFDYLKKVLTQEEKKELNVDSSSPPETQERENKLQVATAALYVEIATADGHFADEERIRIIKTIQNEFSLTKECVKDLIDLREIVRNSFEIKTFLPKQHKKWEIAYRTYLDRIKR